MGWTKRFTLRNAQKSTGFLPFAALSCSSNAASSARSTLEVNDFGWRVLVVVLEFRLYTHQTWACWLIGAEARYWILSSKEATICFLRTSVKDVICGQAPASHWLKCETEGCSKSLEPIEHSAQFLQQISDGGSQNASKVFASAWKIHHKINWNFTLSIMWFWEVFFARVWEVSDLVAIHVTTTDTKMNPLY